MNCSTFTTPKTTAKHLRFAPEFRLPFWVAAAAAATLVVRIVVDASRTSCYYRSPNASDAPFGKTFQVNFVLPSVNELPS